MEYLVTCSVERFDARFMDLDAAILYCETVTRRYGTLPLYAVISGMGIERKPIMKFLRGACI